jgi:predicted transport protein
MKFSEIIDPKNLCTDVTDKGRWGNGDIEVGLENEGQLNDVMELIIQSFNKQVD